MKTLTDKQYLDRIQAAILLRQQGYYDQATHVIRDLMSVRPTESSVWHQAGQIATATGDAEGAVTGFGQSLKLLKEHGALATHALQFQASALGYGQSLMRLGRFSEAWPYFESGRLHVSWSPWPATEYWDGTVTSIPSLLVQSEGGYGDIFMFMRWLPLLKSQPGVGRVGLMIFKGLGDFCDWKALGVDEIYRTDLDKIPFGRWQYSTSIMSLGACFGMRDWTDRPDPDFGEDVFPTRALRTDRGRVFKLGFCWRAEENSSPIKTKSLDVDTAAEIARFVSDQWERDERDDTKLVICSLSPEKKDLYNSEPFIQPPGLAYEPGSMESWRDTAYYLLSMDYVLTVDTAVGHLCGVLGVPSLVLVPRGGCWRFGPEDNVVHPWYGPHCRLYRQPKVLEWDAAGIAARVTEKIDAAAA